jgi:phosphopantothenoylcysteine decarboxylase/phosphopantothenate--cysteine ligase
MADNLLSSCALAASCPLVLAPAMNNHMYEHPATRANLATLRDRGVRIVEPDVGRLASEGEEGIGRLAEPARLLAACEEVLAGNPAAAQQNWRGLKVLVTAGGTREPIDSVRFLGNSSSGRMGLALARAAHARGAKVTLIAANVSLARPAGVSCRAVTTAAELKAACEEEFPLCDVLLMAAAVADFTPATTQPGKIKKADRKLLELVLEPTDDVLAGLAQLRREGQTLVGFAAEHGDGAIERAREKLAAKRLDAIVVNDISRGDIGFDVDANEVAILGVHGDRSQVERWDVPRATKAQVAQAILDVVGRLRYSG